MTAAPVLVCSGRLPELPDSDPCGAVYDVAGVALPVESARVAGWRVGPARDDGTRPVMCPRCARPRRAEETYAASPAVAQLETLPGL